MAVFNTYEEYFLEARDEISRRVASLRDFTGAEKRNEVREIEKTIEDADETLQDMGLAVRNLSGAAKSEGQTKVQRYTNELTNLRKSLRQSEVAFTELAERDELFNTASSDIAVTSLDSRTRLLTQTNNLSDASDTLRESRIQTSEMIDLGAETMTELYTQRERMERGRDRLRGINDNLTRAKNIMHTMWKRAMTNKLITVLIVLFLIGAMIMVAYIRFVY
eukprot:TRINITY_DN4127_c0_g1_i1.p1 TRINITY_DN4127_c0_g1~~TRINITY_DN4127_c0_g1_i1.p1  ORF type:complete len:221 (+),score=42.69 TRINITY_DN4127_c0_g1_i1:226-888(+)